ncbi:CvpA family protein [Qipengyuania sp. DGS5-3]|uniref:CvpA family protein n=1 Tax=Qipengyuania sp. DGS5-3 TaxID=3349632 RepID=UPI0036D33BC5
MTGFDYIVLGILGVAAIGGFLRGFVQEMLSLAAWVLAVFAIRAMHTPLTEALSEHIGDGISTAILAFALLLLIPYAAMKLIAGRLGQATRDSVLGPIDRILGFGFGAVKGVVVVVIGFSLLTLGFDSVWGYKGRPTWIANARTYDIVDAGSRSLVEMVAQRRAELQGDAEATADP